MKCAISGRESTNLVHTTINGIDYLVMPRFADLQKRIDFVDSAYTTPTGITPSSKIFDFAAEIFHLVDTADSRFADNPKAANIFRTMLSEDLFDDDVIFFAVYTRWLDEIGC